jgi:hypothetical protein
LFFIEILVGFVVVGPITGSFPLRSRLDRRKSGQRKSQIRSRESRRIIRLINQKKKNHMESIAAAGRSDRSSFSKKKETTSSPHTPIPRRPPRSRESARPAPVTSLAHAWIATTRARQVAGHRGPAQLPVLWTIRPHITLGRSRSLGLRPLACSLDHRRSLWSGARIAPQIWFFLSVQFAGFHSNFDRY